MMRRPAAHSRSEPTHERSSYAIRDWSIDSHAAMAEALRGYAPVQRMMKTEEEEKKDEEEITEEELPAEAMDVIRADPAIEVMLMGGRPSKINLFDFIQAFAAGKRDYRQTHVLDGLGKKIAAIKQNADFDPGELAAFQWAADYLDIPPRKKGSGGGSDSLSVKATDQGLAISGRPKFEKQAIELPNMKGGFARRHMIAWHTISAAVGNLVNAFLSNADDRSVMGLKEKLEPYAPQKPPDESANIFKRKSKKPKKPPKEPETAREHLAVAVERLLRVMNSNTRNLWPGPGYENSLINSYQGAMRRWAEQLATMNDDQVTEWRTVRTKELQAKSKKYPAAYARTVSSTGDFIDPAGGMSNKALIEQLPQFADNFEVDRPFVDDRERASKVDLDLMKIAGRFLDRADNVPSSDAAKELLELVEAFMGQPQKAEKSNVNIVPLPSEPPTRVDERVLEMIGGLLDGDDVTDGLRLQQFAGEKLRPALTTYLSALDKLPSQTIRNVLRLGNLPNARTLEDAGAQDKVSIDAARDALGELLDVVETAVENNDRDLLNQVAFVKSNKQSTFTPVKDKTRKDKK